VFDMNIALFGFMGVGKSRVGRILAERLSLSFTDLDEEIEKRAGKPIPAIFEEVGEAGFRQFESVVSKEVSQRDGQVIACGGGTVLNSENLRNLRDNSIMILLTADPQTILKRISEDSSSRPLLKSSNKLERIDNLFSARQSQYLKAANLVIDTSHQTPEQVAEDVLNCLKGVKNPLEG